MQLEGTVAVIELVDKVLQVFFWQADRTHYFFVLSNHTRQWFSIQAR